MKVEPLTEWPVSPKFGATYKLNDALTAFAQYAHGFRAPPYDNANFGFQNPVFGYEILPNPDLKPETSNGFEIGLRGRFDDGSSFSVAGFYNLYKDFIDTKLVGTSPGGLMEFQYVNLSNVTIYGAEARGDWHVLPGLSLRGSIAYAHGEDTDTNAPVDSVDPLKLIGGLRYQHPVDGWGAEAVVTHAWKHTRVSDPSLFQAPSYTTLDLMAFYELNPNFSINAGLFNVTNAKYWNSQDVTGVAADSSNLGLYAQPGRSFAINATLRW
jgi:hemoglobin/transferrin/lactoferrin receptor protein